MRRLLMMTPLSLVGGRLGSPEAARRNAARAAASLAAARREREAVETYLAHELEPDKRSAAV
jgi:hypothetical protein